MNTPINIHASKSILLLLFLFASKVHIHAQYAIKIDSLEHELEKTVDDTTRIKILTQLTGLYRDTLTNKEIETAIELDNRLMQLEKKYRFNFNEVSGKRNVEASAINRIRADALKRISTAYENTNFSVSSKYLMQALEISSSLDSNAYLDILLQLGASYAEHHLVDSALIFNNMAEVMTYGTKDTFDIGRVYINKSTIYGINEQYDSLFRYASLARDYFRTIRDQRYLSMAYHNIGWANNRLKNYGDALKAYEESIRISTELGVTTALVRTLANMSNTYSNMGEHQMALNIQLDGLQNILALGAPNVVLASYYLNIGSTFFAMENYLEAQKNYRKAMEVPNMEPAVKNKIYHAMYRVYGKMEKLDSVLKYVKLYDKQKSLAYDKKKLEEISRLQVNHYIESKNQELKLVHKQWEVERSTFRLYLLLIGIIVLFTLCVLYYRFYRKIRLQNKELMDLKDMKQENVALSQKSISSISVKYGNTIKLLNLDEVIFFNSNNKYVYANTFEGKSFIIDYSITGISKILPKDFLKVHQTYVINRSYIDSLKKDGDRIFKFVMKDEKRTVLKSSKSHYHTIKQILDI